ncbi:MAG: hypothetical protein JPMHGGIA_00014 [Saprospiraceae bacterium]|nr:hypothetical protein [Saprospiraceae bacterium]
MKFGRQVGIRRTVVEVVIDQGKGIGRCCALVNGHVSRNHETGSSGVADGDFLNLFRCSVPTAVLKGPCSVDQMGSFARGSHNGIAISCLDVWVATVEFIGNITGDCRRRIESTANRGANLEIIHSKRFGIATGSSTRISNPDVE